MAVGEICKFISDHYAVPVVYMSSLSMHSSTRAGVWVWLCLDWHSSAKATLQLDTASQGWRKSHHEFFFFLSQTRSLRQLTPCWHVLATHCSFKNSYSHNCKVLFIISPYSLPFFCCHGYRLTLELFFSPSSPLIKTSTLSCTPVRQSSTIFLWSIH